MNAQVPITPYPPAAEFVHALWHRVRLGYSRSMTISTRALVQAGAEQAGMLGLVRNAESFGSFLIGCCAEELVAAGLSLKGRAERHYVRDVVHSLRPLVRPVAARRVGPELRRLIVSYAEHPVRLRVKTVSYLLEVNGLETTRERLLDDTSCQLQVECAITVDGIAGCLMQMMESGSVPVSHPGDLLHPAP